MVNEVKVNGARENKAASAAKVSVVKGSKADNVVRENRDAADSVGKADSVDKAANANDRQEFRSLLQRDNFLILMLIFPTVHRSKFVT